MSDEPEIRAAGGVVTRDGPDGTEVAVVHRTRHDDWSLPKGKLDEGESYEQAAVREVEEEIGCRVRLERYLGSTTYEVRGRSKLVRYWQMAVDGEAVADPDPAEIDEVRWLAVPEALRLLSYEYDRELVGRYSAD